MSIISADLLEDCSKQRGLATARAIVERHVAGTRSSELQPWMQNVIDDVSLRPTAAGSTRTDTVVLLRLDSGALECKVYTGCIQAHAAGAVSQAVVSHGRTCMHQQYAVLFFHFR